MERILAAVAVGVLGCGASAGAQTRVEPQAAQRAERYQIGTMERVLENAVEHGAAVMRDRLRALIPADMLLSDDARARGFRLAGYGVFFDVVVPNLEGTLPWIFRTLDQTDLDLQNALKTLRAMVDAQGSDPRLQDALKRVELQVAPYAPSTADTRRVTAASTDRANAEAARPPADPILQNPEEAYRTEVIEALMDAMLNHSQGLDLAAGETLTVGARRDDSARLSISDSPARTIQISIKAEDLRAFLSGRIAREEARARMDVRVF